MTNPNQEDAQLTNLSDDYIRDLEPENQRYDITLAQDFVISVLPNGIKTWAFIYDFQGRHRRKTLGVFPEMNFEDAKVALEKARASMLRMDEPTVAPNEFGQLPAVLGGGKYIPKREKKTINPSVWLKLFAGLAIAAVVAFLAIQRPAWLSFGSDETQSNSEPAPSSNPFEVSKPAAAPFAVDKPDPESGNNDSSTEPATAPATQAQPPVTAPTPTTTTPVSTPASTPSPERTAPPTAAPAQVVNTAPASTPPERTESRPVTTLTTASGATAYGGRVARSRLTSRVQDLEPVDTLGPEISYKNSGFTRVFYFTELREFGDGNVVHRWSLNDEVQEEVILKVKKSWRWRTYSNKDITPGLNGEWKIETIDATGTILDTETFTYDYQ